MKTQKYYKIVAKHTMFYPVARIQGIHDIATIPLGSICYAYKPFKPNDVTIQYSQPVLHFCDNAFDVMLWASKMDSFAPTKFIYEITPLTDVIKQRCPDITNLYQCGAYKIRFENSISEQNMFDKAIFEYENAKIAKETLYPNLDLVYIIQSWKQHKYPEHLCMIQELTRR